ncbi:MAG: hypothetical protein WDZ45_07135 [Flavobacteriaceae bacterium]
MKPKNNIGTTRREFIEQMSLLGMASMLPLSFFSCGKDAPNIDYQGTGLAPYKVWEEMLMAIKTSPDFLEGRMQRLIEEGNPEAMFHFVKDELFLMPSSATSLIQMRDTMRYGLKGVLRYGFATPREKAELLNFMFTKANITSKVIYEQTNFQPEEVLPFFYRPFQRKFEPLIDKKTLKRWSSEMGAEESNAELANPDPDLTESKNLAQKLWEKLPEKDKIRAKSFNYRWDNSASPALEFEWEGETKYAHLFDPSVPFGNLKLENGRTSPAKEAQYDNENVAIELSYRDGINPLEEKILVQGEWPTHELAGNQVVLSFLNGLNVQKQITTAVGNLRIFTPALSYQSFDAEKSFMEARSFLGNPVTLEGKIIDVSGKEASIGNSTLLTKPNPNLQKEIRQIEVKAIPGSYPSVKLHVSPRNENGEIIDGLSAADFSVSDNNMPVQAIMESNQRTPRVIILSDTSLSMPKTYFGENMDAFVENLQKAILEKYPETQITKWKTNSDLYTWLTKASYTSNDLIIYATDGDNGDKYDAVKMEKLKFGPPALVLNVSNSTDSHRKESFQNMANATNGLVLDAKDQEKTITNITKYIDEREIPSYVFTYHATEKEANHKVEVHADNQRVKASDEYNFKLIPVKDTEAGEHIIGLYLSVKVGNQTVRRVLSGWDHIVDKNRKPTFKDFTDVQNMLLGNVLISIEGQGPTFANALSDILKYRLSTRKWGEAVLKNEIKNAVEAYEEGGLIYDENLASLMQPLQNSVTSQSMTFAAGPRIAIVKTWAGINREFSKYSFDFLPTSNYTTLTNNALEGFKITMEKTAQLAILENYFFETSTLSALSSKSIISVTEAKNTEWFKQLYREGPDANYWRERIYRGDGSYKSFDASASEKAFWRVDNQTGELYGMLPDLSGGGTNRIQVQLDELSKVMNMYSLLFSAMGVGTLPIGIVTAYGLTLVKLYAIASEAIIIMDTSGMDEKIAEAMKQLACNVKKEIILATMGPVGTVIGGIDNLIGLMGGGGIPGMQC